MRCNKCGLPLQAIEYINGGTCRQCIRKTWRSRFTRAWRRCKAFVSELLPKRPKKYLTLSEYAKREQNAEGR